MTTIRTFIAIELSAEAQEALRKLQQKLAAKVPPNSVRWAAPRKIHLTLHFLGNIDSGDVKTIGQAIKLAAADSRPFSLRLAGVGCFPNARRPRIIWAGLKGSTTPLVTLHKNLGDLLANAIGFAPDGRPYAPHLTIGRIKRGVSGQTLAEIGPALAGDQFRPTVATLNVAEVSFIQSELTPNGPKYTPLAKGVLI